MLLRMVSQCLQPSQSSTNTTAFIKVFYRNIITQGVKKMNNNFELQRIVTLKLEKLQDTIHNDINLLYFVNAETEEQRN